MKCGGNAISKVERIFKIQYREKLCNKFLSVKSTPLSRLYRNYMADRTIIIYKCEIIYYFGLHPIAQMKLDLTDKLDEYRKIRSKKNKLKINQKII